MLSRALRFGLGRTTTSVRTYAAAGRLDDWENFKMPGTPYADMGPLPPAPAKLDDAGKTRMTYISESYFKLLEGKLGYTGPYTLLFGGLLTALSKEWLILGPEMFWAASAAVFYSFVFNGGVAAFMDREGTVFYDLREQRVSSWKEYKVGLVSSEIDGIARLKEQTAGLAMIQEQRKVNLDLALDAEHMNRQADLVEAVKKRLDYQVAVNNAERDAHAKHMIKWIDAEVNAAIAKRSSKDDLAAAIAQLKSMAAK
jgi:hypothetical protein